ncbi:MAG: glycosyltransferase family 4 protein [Dysgonamonadaceae bacterium]|jgi:glycosyltransferase involved in cell wall biosynthesis|nr:glycosyltransferase family 4 protein [Dysgonamonadaceae bacterium]
MNIGFDAKRAVQNNTGLGNYSRFVVETLSQYFPYNKYCMFAPKKQQNNRLKTLLNRPNVNFVLPSGINKILPSAWRILMKKDIEAQNVQIFHGLSNELPLRKQKNAKTVVTIHDLIFLRYPQFYKPADRIIYRLKFKQACLNANAIIAVSECTKQDIIRFFAIPEEKITVIYQSCHPQFHTNPTEKQEDFQKKYNLPQKFILSVGSIEERKNLLLTVKALKYLPQTVHLVAVGKKTPYLQKVQSYAQKNHLQARLHVLNRFPFEELPKLYRSAAAFVYPSLFEGFGIPIIEALACGTPVIAATGSCLREAGGPNSLYVDPHNEQQLAESITRILNSPDAAKEMSEKGKIYVRKFDPEIIAKQMMALYNNLRQPA